ncbi:MAG: archaellin/type IV pilin N-terminal domain-containing protein [Candidatus Muiribacteriota bacterium]
MMDKKGVSPLVATVLLIAFSVSLGAVIMNWTTAAGIEETNHEDVSNLCEAVSISLFNDGAEKSICLDRDKNKLIMDVENKQKKIDGLRISFLGKKSDFIDYKNSIESGVLSHIELDYDPAIYGELKNIKVLPYIKKTDKLYCSNKAITLSTIKDCD